MGLAAEGRLSLRHFPGPPNYTSIREGDKDDLVFILTLPQPVCIDARDFGQSQRFRTVHVWSLDKGVRGKLHRMVGRRVIISGDGYPMDNANHRAPLVLNAKSVRLP